MSEQIKYEAVFGPQELFEKLFTLSNAEVIYFTPHELPENQYTWSRIDSIDNQKRSGTYVIAMRRIIRTPTWTVADQKAGKLPGVGCIVVRKKSNDECLVVFKSSNVIVLFSESFSSAVSVSKSDFFNYFRALETPEEKAARLRDEWVEKAVGATPVYEFAAHGYSTQLRIDISSIYDALLSGELQAPKGE